jgi:hypothetical protein
MSFFLIKPDMRNQGNRIKNENQGEHKTFNMSEDGGKYL